MDNVKAIFDKLREQIDIKDYDDAIFSSSNFEVFTDDLYNTNIGLFDCEAGATKLVLFFDSEDDKVFKIPFKGYYDEEGDCDEYGAFVFIPFQCANWFNWDDYENIKWDYCHVETQIYELAKEKGLEEFFAKTEKIYDWDEIPIYVQPRCVSFWESEGQHYSSENSKQLSKKILNDKWYHRIPEEWFSVIIEMYGREKAEKFLDFIMDLELCDLHDSNVGYCGNRPVIIDYAEFKEV